jgi:hypothetical protein
MIENDVRASIEDVLRRCQMPPEEIRWVLMADDPAIVHMLLELHVERLGEEFAARCSALRELEVSLTSAALGAAP